MLNREESAAKKTVRSSRTNVGSGEVLGELVGEVLGETVGDTVATGLTVDAAQTLIADCWITNPWAETYVMS